MQHRSELRHAPQRDDRKMLSSRDVRHVEFDDHTRCAVDWCAGSNTSRTNRPACPRLNPRLFVRRRQSVVHLVRSATAEPGARARAVVPRREDREFGTECFVAQGDEESASSFFLERSDEPFDDGDAPLFADGAESRANAAAPAPALEAFAPELHTLVANEVFRGGAGLTQDLGKQLLEQTRLVFRQWSRCRNGTLSQAGLKSSLGKTRHAIERLLMRGLNCRHSKTSGMCQELLRHRHWLWTFLTTEGVEPTNNASERALRPAEIWRKLSFGTQGAVGKPDPT